MKFYGLAASAVVSVARLLGSTVLVAGLLAGPVQAQLYNAPGAIFFQSGTVYTSGLLFQNAGTYVPHDGPLIISDGDLLNTGTISAGPGTVELRASSARSLALNGQSVAQLTLNVPAGTTLTNSGTVSGSLTLLGGDLQTSAVNTLILAPAAVLIGETSAGYVKGHVNQTQVISGAGAAPVDFGQMGLTVTPAGQSFTLTVDRRAGLLTDNVSQGRNLALTNQSIDRLWAFSSPNTITAPVTVALTWLSDNDNGLAFSPTNAQVWRSDNNGGQWVKQNAAADGTGRHLSITTTQLNALYTVSTTAAPLPVELLRFAATNVGGDGDLRWQTASERNSAFMEVQASTDGQRWQVLGQVVASGTSTTPRDYAFADRNLRRYTAARVYYRLRLVDLDGTTTSYSPLVSLTVPTAEPSMAVAAFGLTAWPNPFAGPLMVRVQLPQAGAVSLVLFDAEGRSVLRRELSGELAGPQELVLDEVAMLPSGSYTLLARQGRQEATLHVIRQ